MIAALAVVPVGLAALAGFASRRAADAVAVADDVRGAAEAALAWRWVAALAVVAAATVAAIWTVVVMPGVVAAQVKLIRELSTVIRRWVR